MLPALALALAAAATGCAPGSEGPESVGYVLLDRDARAAGRLQQSDWGGAPVLPVGLDLSEPVAYASSTGRTVVDLRADSLAYIHGAAGTVEWLRLGEDASDERLRVYGTRDSAADLARWVGGRVDSGEDGLWTIAAPGLLERASFLKPPDGITEVTPDTLLAAAPVVDKRAVLGPVGALPEGETEGVRQALVVGAYTLGHSALFLDASGGFSLEDACSGDVLGRGRFRTDGDHIVLDSDTAPMLLTWEAGELRDQSGARYAPLTEPAPPPPPAAANVPEAPAPTGGDL